VQADNTKILNNQAEIGVKRWDSFHTVVRSQKGAINHRCFEVDDLDATIKHSQKNGAHLVEGSSRAEAHGWVALFRSETTDRILIEIFQIKMNIEAAVITFLFKIT
jgi:catechol 2,3-dioxygenase-like lactoylglutathione lyase family enzyme